jgi:hypothetical protein
MYCKEPALGVRPMPLIVISLLNGDELLLMKDRFNPPPELTVMGPDVPNEAAEDAVN